MPRTESSEVSSEDEHLYVLGNSAHINAPMATVNINDTPVRMMINTGASVDIMDEKSFNQIQNHGTIDLQPPQKCIYAYGSESQLDVLGQFTAYISTGTKHVESVGSQQQIKNELIHNSLHSSTASAN